MNLKFAIQSDEVIHHNGERQSYSRRWGELAAGMGIDVVPVDVFSPDIMAAVGACDAFMWRYDPSACRRLYAHRLLYAIEQGLGLPTFPSLASRWHFEDKVGQAYFLAAAGIPIPATTVCWSLERAQHFCQTTTYPFVLKLATGYQSSNVRLVRTRDDALFYARELFGRGVTSLGYRPAPPARLWLRRVHAAVELVRGRNPYGSAPDADLQYGYFMAQEFLPDNPFDVRVTVTGNRAFVYRRFNRPDDFRASGSGNFDWDPAQVPEDAVRLGYKVARASNSQTITVDILRRNRKPVIIELGLAYASWCVRDCPGHWVLHGDPETGRLEWAAGALEPADAILTDFVSAVRAARHAGRT